MIYYIMIVFVFSCIYSFLEKITRKFPPTIANNITHHCILPQRGECGCKKHYSISSNPTVKKING